jgi:predicted transcriptional regulator
MKARKHASTIALQKDRVSYDILHDILKQLDDQGTPIRTTKIMYACNLSYDQLRVYLPILLSNGLLTTTQVERDGNAYQITDAGRTYISQYAKLRAMFK